MIAGDDQPPPHPGLPRLPRLTIYALVWLPVLVVVVYFVPTFDPILAKLDEKGQLPTAVAVLFLFNRYDTLSYHLLSLFVLVGMLALDEAVILFLRPYPRAAAWAWVWFAFVLFAGVYTFGFILFALLLTLMKMSSVVS